MECEMQAVALSSIMLINIKIKKVLKYLEIRLLTALYTKHKECNLLIPLTVKMLRCLKSGVVCAFHLVNVIARRAFFLSIPAFQCYCYDLLPI